MKNNDISSNETSLYFLVFIIYHVCFYFRGQTHAHIHMKRNTQNSFAYPQIKGLLEISSCLLETLSESAFFNQTGMEGASA